MNNKENIRNTKQRRLGQSKKIILLASIALVLVGVVGGSLAYIVTHTDPVVNEFTPSSNDPEITEKFDGETKEDVIVQVKGDTELKSYVRAKIVFSWVTADGAKVAPVSASEADCKECDINTAYWQKAADGYYYYKGKVAGGGKTENLINTCTPKENEREINGETYYFCVDIFTQTIQADPAEAVQEAWGVDPTTLGNTSDTN